MKEETVIYPEYRKYNNNKSFFKIISPEKFEEIKFLGSKKSIHFFEAKILPDRNYISDLTFNYSEHWIVCAKSEYEELRREIYS
jgi:hypothetical protein|tara:strand:- start:297 stop:548 length:252 start_codon:yes stop_codon:yes gene_type:complete